MDWSQNSSSNDNITATDTTEEQNENPAPVKKRGTYKIITNYLESGYKYNYSYFIIFQNFVLGEGEEGLDWELCMTEEGDTAILQYPYYICVSNRLSTLPADFLQDLLQVLRLAAGFLHLVVSSLWEQPRKPRIELTVATPDYDYLPDNHPLRKINLHKASI